VGRSLSEQDRRVVDGFLDGITAAITARA